MKPLFGNPKRTVLIVVLLLIVFSTLAVSDGQAATRVVKLFYFLPNDQTYDAKTVETLKRWIVEIQSFYREQMEAHGHGSKTFQIETDANGDPKVHRVDGAHDSIHYANTPRPYELEEIRGKFDTSQTVQLVYVDLTVHPKYAGQGVGIKQRGDAVIYQRSWGTVVHELGHAFGLHHDFRDGAYIMSYDDSRGSLSKCAADFLAMSPYFNPDIPIASADAPSVKLSDSPDYTTIAPDLPGWDDPPKLGLYQYGIRTVRLRVRVEDPDGLHQVFLLVKTEPGHGSAGFFEVVDCRFLSGETDTVVEFTYDGSIPSARQYPSNLLNRIKHNVYISAVDKQGNRIDHPKEIVLQPSKVKQAKVPVGQRSPRVAESIYKAVRLLVDRHVSVYEEISDAHLAGISGTLGVPYINASDSGLQSNDFDGLTNLSTLELNFESGYSDRTLLPYGIFEGLTSLEDLHIKYYAHTYGDDPTLYPHIPLTIGLKKVGAGQFRAIVHEGATYDMNVPLIVVNGSITGGATSVKIHAGSMESEILTVTRTSGTTAAVIVDLERVVQRTSGSGFLFYKTSFPLELLSPLAGAPNAVSERTPQVIEAIVGEVPAIDHKHHNRNLTYFINGDFVDKKYNTAPHVSEAHLAAITSLNVTGNRGFTLSGLTGKWFSTHGNMTALKSGDFDGMSNLTSLNLSGNELSSLPSGIFDNLTELTSLNLFKNKLSSLSTGSFDKLTKLETLNLSGNELSSLPAGLFDKLTNLTYLNLLDNPLRSLPDGYFDKLTKLETLFLPPNVKQPLLPGTGTITTVANRTPKVRDAIVAAVPGVNSAANITVTHLAAITELDMSESKITALKTGDFDGLINLEGLVVGDTLSSLPDGIFDNLTRLEGLVLGGTLPSLPDGIFDNLLNLKTLYISGTQLSSLPDGIFDNLTNMQTFGLINTQLSSLPDGIFDSFTNVPFIYLNDNKLRSLPTGIFDKATMRVFLHNNKFSSLPDGIFKGSFTKAPDLTGLELLGVPLGAVPDGHFDGIDYTTLYLTGNTVDPLPLTISLKRVGNGQFKAVAPAGAPFKLVLPISVANGSISGGATSITIPVGAVESQTFTVTRTPGTTSAVAVDIETLPGLPENHTGYTLVKSSGLVFTEFGGFLQVSERTPAVRDAIVRAVPGVNSAANVNEAHLAAITDLRVDLRNGVKVGDFDGLTGLTEFGFTERQLTSIPAGLFKDLSSVTELIFRSAKLTTLPDGLFDAFTNVTSLSLVMFELTSLPEGIFDPFTLVTECEIYIPKLTSSPDGLFSGFTSLTSPKLFALNLNTVDPLPYTVSLEKVANGQFKAVVPTGAPFDIVLPITVTNGSISNGATSITIATSSTESGTLTVTRTPGTTAAVTVNIGTLPGIPSGHSGYKLVKSTTGLPLTLTPAVINNAPVFTDGTSTTRSIAENTASGQNIGTAIAAADADSGNTLTYTLGGRDAASFSIVSTSGQLQTKAALDYETKTSYTVTITVSDGNGGSDSITVTINVTDVNENRAPVFTDGTSTTRTIAENTATGQNIGTAIAATDADSGDTLTYTLGGTDAASFSIVSTSGQVQTKAALDYETKTSYAVTITVSDGNSGTDSITVTINVTDVNERQASTTSTTTYNIGDDITTLPSGYWTPDTTGNGASVKFSNGQITLTFNDEGYIEKDGTTYTCDAVGGCKIIAGQVTQGTIQATTEGASAPVTTPPPATNNDPVFTDGTSTTRSIAENTTSGQNIGTAIAATDADNNTLTYTLGGTNAAAFSLVSTSGQLQTKAALDYETKRTYSVTLTVSDGNGGTDSIAVTINVTDVQENRVPVFTAGTSTTRTIAENTASGQNIGTVIAATDVDNDTLTYTLGGTDAAAFSIVSTSGQLQTKAAIDYETKASYTITITVSDGNGGTDSITVTITVTDVNEASTSTSTGMAICKVGDVLKPGQSCTYPDTDAVFSVLPNGNSQWNIPNLPPLLQWINKTSVGNSMNVSTTVNGVDYHFAAKSVSNNSWEVKEIGNSAQQTPETPQPGNTGGTPTLSLSTASTLTEATLHEGVVTLTLSNGAFESSEFDIRRSLTVSGITDADFHPFSVVRVSDTKATVELEFDGNMTTNGTLTFELASNAIADYDGTALTSQISVSAVTESITASTTASLTEATLDESVVTVTLSGRKYVQSTSRIRLAVSVTGISGVTVRSFDIDRESDTEVTVELTYNGNMTSDGTLTFTVKDDAIAGYDGSALTAQVSVSAGTETPVVTQPQQPQQPTQTGNTGGTPTLSLSTASTLTEAILHGAVVSLNLSGGTFEGAFWDLDDEISTSGITGVTYHNFFDVDRISDTQVDIELSFDSNMTSNGTLTFTVESGAIVDYDGSDLTAQISVSAVTESITVSTTTALTEGNIDGSEVTITLSGRKFERSVFTIRGAFSVSGITGVTIPWHDPDKDSDTQLSLELEFDGDMTQNGTLTFTVEDDAIAGYSGSSLTAQLSVTAAGAIGLFANYPNPFNPETWIPYQLAKPSDVIITIYDVRGRVVRVLALGHQAAGMYQNRSRAAYWDGKNKFGESVASGAYFYTLSAGEFTATRKMLIRK